MTLFRTVVGSAVVVFGLAACAAESTSDGSESTTRASRTGSSVVTSHAEGDDIVSSIDASKTGDSLTVTFDRATNSARIAPRSEAARTVPVATFPADAAAATRLLGEAVDRGAQLASGSGGGTKMQRYPSEPPTCAETCNAACDAVYTDAVENACCRFGCSIGCALR